MSPRRLGRLFLLLGAALFPLACARGSGTGTPAGTLLVSDGRHTSGFTRNFNPFLPESLWPTRAGIYESLLVFNSIKGTYVPWLAAEFHWSDANTKLTFTLKTEVRWSDGRPLTARDVAFSFDLVRRNPALDTRSVWVFLSDVRARDERTVEFLFKRAYTPGLVYIGHHPVVPEHAWREVADPAAFRNESPVASGPFTAIRTFSPEVYEVGRNETYWQAGKPKVRALRVPAFSDNEAATRALLEGHLDWAGLFVPDVEATFVAKDRAHHRYWFPPVGNPVLLYLNTTRRPWADASVRKAVSLAIDRTEIVKTAMHGYAVPLDATGLPETDQKWKDPEAVRAGYWVERDVARANAMLDAAGLRRGPDGVRRTKEGAPMRYAIDVVRGWSDWVAAVEVVARNLREVGIEAQVQSSEFAAWNQRVATGSFDVSIGFARHGPTPYHFYRGQMSGETARPLGEAAYENWQRFVSPAADELLRKFEVTNDPEERRTLNHRLQALFVELAPSLPLFPGPSWGESSSVRFSGFPDEQNPYARLAPFQDEPEPLLVLLELQPR
jgi:peptide/nickel transport system substrate-binding protein